MPKKIKKEFYKKLTFEKMLAAHKRAKKSKTYRYEVLNFELNLENNILNLIKKLKTNTYTLGDYYTFTIYEPKKRIIKALPYIDRVVQQWYVEEFIKPYIVPKFINTTYACLTDKGTHGAVKNVQNDMRKMQKINPNFWILKCDISKFFYSIDPNILYNIMQKYISDKALLNFTKLLIFDTVENSSIGIPIGNYSSQYFANIYMNELNVYIKETLKCKYFTIYMDDFILLLNSKKECIEVLEKIRNFLKVNLHLELNNKSRYYPNKMGVNFCGYRIWSTHRLLRTNSKKKIKCAVKKWNKLYSQNKLNFKKASLSLNSWLGHASHCNSYKLQQKILNSCDFLYSDKMYQQLNDEIVKNLSSYNK